MSLSLSSIEAEIGKFSLVSSQHTLAKTLLEDVFTAAKTMISLRLSAPQQAALSEVISTATSLINNEISKASVTNSTPPAAPPSSSAS
jgi:hypothetical protein